MDKQLYSQTEKRMLKEFPPYPGSFGEVSKFIQNITDYLNDHFGLRKFYVHRYQREVRKRFDVIGDEVEVEKKLPELSFKKNFSFSREVSRDCDPNGNRCGDLTEMLLDFEPFTEPYRAVDKYAICSQKQALSLALSNLEQTPEPLNIETFCPGKNYTAVVFHDSFFVSIRPFFSENFGRVVYLWKYFDQKNMEEILEIFKPDIVVEERVERSLFGGLSD